jgi:hypothetical protein
VAEFRVATELNALDTERLLRVLDAHGVAYVLIGGVACLVHGASQGTRDTDLVPATDDANLAKLYDALVALNAAVFVEPRRLEMEGGAPWEVESLRRGAAALRDADAWHFVTDGGPVDLVFTAAGVGGFDDHLARAERLELFGVQVLVAGLDDLITSKTTLGREKDAFTVSELRRLRDERG